LLVVLRIHEVKIVALVVQVFEFDFIQDGAVHEFFRAKPVIDDRTRTEVPLRVCIEPRLLPGVR